MISHKKVELLNLGDELLLGLRANAHLVYLGKRLKELGLHLSQSTVIRDDAQAIGRAFKDSWERADIVITTGGLGSTEDDKTREAIASSLGLELTFEPKVEAHWKKIFGEKAKPFSKSLMKQCYKPEGSEVLLNHSGFGTAPGIFLKHAGKFLVMLPGPPAELHPMFENAVIPRLKEESCCQDAQAGLQLRTIGLGETHVEKRLDPLLTEYPEVALAFCVHLGIVDVRLSLKVGAPIERLDAAGKRARELLGNCFFTFGDASLESIVIQELKAKKQTIAVAESCTGGLLASALTDIPGASEVFLGGVLAYSNDAKVNLLQVPKAVIQEHGAVSEETALAMASGAAGGFSADFAISTTGIAGPTGGTPEKPVGTVFLGFHSRHGSDVQKIQIPGGRLVVKERTVQIILDWLRRKLEAVEA